MLARKKKHFFYHLFPNNDDGNKEYKKNITKSDFAVLTHITAVIIRLKRGMFGLTRHNPQYKLNQKISYGLLIDSFIFTSLLVLSFNKMYSSFSVLNKIFKLSKDFGI